jgi:uncharacterized repeat protein (TIGR03833 family)
MSSVLLFSTRGRKKIQKKRNQKKKSKKEIKKSNTNKLKTKKVKKITCQELDDREKNQNLGKIRPNVGDRVMIIIKPYHKFNCVSGEVRDVLTRKPIHTRGHKVRIQSGEIGRTLKIINHNHHT